MQTGALPFGGTIRILGLLSSAVCLTHDSRDRKCKAFAELLSKLIKFHVPSRLAAGCLECALKYLYFYYSSPIMWFHAEHEALILFSSLNTSPYGG